MGARFTPKAPRAWKLFWAHPMVLLGDVCQVETRFVSFGDSVNVGACFAPNVPQTWKSFQAHLMVLLCDVGQVEAHFGPFGDSINIDAR
jgi:hypothetical protein